ncbi:HD domain-containing protein [Paenibacillus piscarius]|uniref:HD domain-containing protein n=1 Tax=Paenibacillus piscarius TaxID=1089681 RepID=UPI001EE95424
MRRLHYIRHGGASFINTHHTFSRLQHTLGVFALTAHFEPDNRTLRAAALLHDIGHAPFSHTLESIPGVDHHDWTRGALFSEEIVNILSRAKIYAADLMEYIDGSNRSILRNNDGVLHADHLDSWVRSAFIGGYLTISTDELLDVMSYKNGSLQFPLDAGERVTSLIWEEARMQASPANIGVNAIMRKLAGCLVHNNELDTTELPLMTDAHIEQLLLNVPDTQEEYEKLLMESWRIRVSRNKPAFPAETAALSKLYLAMPLIQGVLITEYSPDVLATINQLTELIGTYYVWWE